MAENIRKSSSCLSSQMTVLEKGQDVARPSSGGAVKKTLKKSMPSEGLIVLSPEPGPVQFDNTAARPASGVSRPGSRVGSAGHIEKKLQMARKPEVGQGEHHLPNEAKRGPRNEPSVSKETRQDIESDSSDTSSDSESSSAEDTGADAGACHPSHTGAPVELKGEFLKCIMDEDYKKAQELCKEILLLEPDNATCREFHSVIHEKIKQDEDDDDDDDEEESEEESEDSDDDEEAEGEEGSDDEEDEDSEESESDEDVSLPPGPINLLMGGLPVRPQKR